MTEPRNARYPALVIYDLRALSLGAETGILAADGSIWSHAATLGTRTKGETFTIDRATVDAFVRNFSAAGGRMKVPVDYEHGSTTDDPEIRRARAMGKVPKAGDVVEMKGVYGADDFAGTLKTAAEALAAKAGRPLSDENNFGLWIRWRPTQRALQAIQAGEYTELSIAFDDDFPNNIDGKGQGPTILAVALLNLPFLTDMLPVAASLHGGSPAAPGNGETRMSTENKRALVLLAATAAVVGKAVTDEEQAITELQAFEPEAKSLRSFRTDVAAAIGEPDPAKAITKIKALAADVARLAEEAKVATKAKIDGQIETTMKKYEKRLTVPLKAMITTQLRAEIEKGVELEKTEAWKALESMKDLGITEQATGGDLGGANEGEDVKIDAKARQLMTTNPRLKAMIAAGKEYDAYVEALSLAGREVRLVTT